MASRSPTKALSLREQAKLSKWNRILAAGEELFKERDFDEVTTRELAERAGIGEATFFRYISSKIELLLMIYGEKMEKVLDQIEIKDVELAVQSSQAADYIGRIYAIYDARAEFYRQDPSNGALYLREAFKAGSKLGTKGMAQGDRLIRLVAEILRDGQAKGVLIESVDATIIAQNCHGIFIHEVDRTPVRGFTPDSIAARVRVRLSGQLQPLAL